MLISDRIFVEPGPSPQRKKEVAERVARDHPDQFQSPDSAAEFLRHIFTARSRRWSFAGNGKSGTSSTFLFLFRAEFGCECNVKFDDPVDINTHSTIHKAKAHGIFRSLFDQAADIGVVEKTNRFTVVRHPNSRALSSYLYFCKTNELAREWMLRDRMWINAAVGFNWDKDPGTINGFIKFLDYIEQVLDAGKPHLVNPHWRPQYLNIVPAVYQPGLIGRMEEFDNFLRGMADRLEISVGDDVLENIHANKQAAYDTGGFLDDPAVISRIEKIYQRDFDLFEYSTS